MKQVLVLGGGAAGLAAAIELSHRGIPTTVVDSAPPPGGQAFQLACKGSPACLNCDACRPHDLRREALRDPMIDLLAGSELGYVAPCRDGFQATVRRPEGCEDHEFAAVILAVGAMPFNAAMDVRYRYGECADVLTSLDVERALLETNALAVPSTGRDPESIAVVQCVGSRDVRRGVPYCSKACCKYASKLGRRLRHLYPEMELTFFFMDWRPLEASERSVGDWAAGDRMVKTVRSRPSEVVPGDRPLVRYATEAEDVAEKAFDIVMLTVGMVPRPDNPRLAEALGISLDDQGFLRSARDDVLVAGTCAGPKDLKESIEEGIAAAGRAASFLEAK